MTVNIAVFSISLYAQMIANDQRYKESTDPFTENAVEGWTIGIALIQ